MFRFIPYVMKNLLRQRTRTALTVSGSAVALFVFSIVASIQEGLEHLSADAASERTLVVYQANRFCPSTSRLPEDYARQIRQLSGVREVVPIQLFTNNCRASLDMIVFNGMPPEKLKTARQFELIRGDWSDFVGRGDAALVGTMVARRRGLDVGQKFTLSNVSVQIVGVFRAAVPAEDNFIYTHLEFLQQTPGLRAIGTVTHFEVQLTEAADPDAIARKIDELFRGGPVPTDTRLKGVFQRGAIADLAELIGFARYLGYACVGLVLALVATTTVMAVQDRIREHAVLQTLGFSGPRIFALVVTESVLVSLLGGGLGVAAAMGILTWGGLAIGTEGVTIAFVATWRLAATGLVVAAGVGLLAAAVPAWQAARAEIVASLRAV